MSNLKITDCNKEDIGNILNSLNYLMHEAKRLKNEDLYQIIGIAYELGSTTYGNMINDAVNIDPNLTKDDHVRAAWLLYKFLSSSKDVQEETLLLLEEIEAPASN